MGCECSVPRGQMGVVSKRKQTKLNEKEYGRILNMFDYVDDDDDEEISRRELWEKFGDPHKGAEALDDPEYNDKEDKDVIDLFHRLQEVGMEAEQTHETAVRACRLDEKGWFTITKRGWIDVFREFKYEKGAEEFSKFLDSLFLPLNEAEKKALHKLQALLNPKGYKDIDLACVKRAADNHAAPIWEILRRLNLDANRITRAELWYSAMWYKKKGEDLLMLMPASVLDHTMSEKKLRRRGSNMSKGSVGKNVGFKDSFTQYELYLIDKLFAFVDENNSGSINLYEMEQKFCDMDRAEITMLRDALLKEDSKDEEEEEKGQKFGADLLIDKSQWYAAFAKLKKQAERRLLLGNGGKVYTKAGKKLRPKSFYKFLRTIYVPLTKDEKKAVSKLFQRMKPDKYGRRADISKLSAKAQEFLRQDLDIHAELTKCNLELSCRVYKTKGNQDLLARLKALLK
uniref:Uncharacterized protein n=1 Tax=Lotharella oceanica TaxID=641309 RepID=A0A7S2TNR1_9EUKA|mmetsp:Transcript_19890/g.37397  ORF Transcript_19890/g.37397 Transcript_19890/m.37397 type:complete len:456 (+) Transcript_19890:136-1503(+)|eukprot:CAMPEP_0170169138 /NCGR_PEP_ID=MMETSP0040_2-20121228/2079_1 /TAXON_ID=641309 /ORGANISM="Lotharella oceanica, Strain CCMP622" /LENGTH=455 /DNA_ID=CAMNT_0010407725 /DNA_START=86 /DNA_END=1453 /DNA_ORIENTATION=-